MISHRHPRSVVVALDRSPQDARALRAPAGRSSSSLDGRSGHSPRNTTPRQFRRETGAGPGHAPRVPLLSRESGRRPVEDFPWLLIFGPSIALCVVYALAWRIGAIEWWTERVIVWGMR